MKILIADDDPQILRALKVTLGAHGYEIHTASDGREALDVAMTQHPDLVMLDLGMPRLDGVEVIAGLRGWSTAPVLVVSGRTDAADKVEALDAGADDYVTKPFDMEELLARVRSAIRRAGPGDASLVVTAGGVRLDVTERRATRDGDEVRLTPTEWHIVEVLARRQGRLVRQADLLHEVWGPGYDRETNYLRVYLAQIRRKLESDPSRPTMFITDPGIGYRLVTPG